MTIYTKLFTPSPQNMTDANNDRRRAILRIFRLKHSTSTPCECAQSDGAEQAVVFTRRLLGELNRYQISEIRLRVYLSPSLTIIIPILRPPNPSSDFRASAT